MLVGTIPIVIGLVFGASVTNFLFLLIGLFLSSACFAALGIMFASIPTENPGDVTMALNFVRLPLIFISGIYKPIEDLPHYLRVITLLSPLTYANDLLRHALSGETFFGPFVDVISLLLFTLAFLVVGTKLHLKFMDWTGPRKRKMRSKPR